MNTPEENSYGLTTTSSGGLIRRTDQRLELVNRLIEEIQVKQTSLTNTKTLEVPLGSGTVMLMKWCPPGSFLMGSPEDLEGRFNDENQVQVTLSKGFWMGQTQVTQAQWRAVMKNNPSFFKGKTHPVERVSWHDAQEFVFNINANIALSDGMQMTLPTEAQWEYAARAGETDPYSGGTLDEVAWYRGNSQYETHQVGTKKANAWGLHDMSGNVAEWCADWYSKKLEGGVDPWGANSGTLRVYRGGSWNGNAFGCHVAFRNSIIPTQQAVGLGFRVARISVP